MMRAALKAAVDNIVKAAGRCRLERVDDRQDPERHFSWAVSVNGHGFEVPY
jgi:hypothetical protein